MTPIDPKTDQLEAAAKEFEDAWFDGQAPRVDSHCARYPECAAALKKRIEDFLFAASAEPGPGELGL